MCSKKATISAKRIELNSYSSDWCWEEIWERRIEALTNHICRKIDPKTYGNL